MTMTILDVFEITIAFLWLVAAALWFVAASHRRADPVELLRRQGKWNRFAALCAGLAATTQVIELVLSHAVVTIGRCNEVSVSLNSLSFGQRRRLK